MCDLYKMVCEHILLQEDYNKVASPQTAYQYIFLLQLYSNMFFTVTASVFIFLEVLWTIQKKKKREIILCQNTWYARLILQWLLNSTVVIYQPFKQVGIYTAFNKQYKKKSIPYLPEGLGYCKREIRFQSKFSQVSHKKIMNRKC